MRNKVVGLSLALLWLVVPAVTVTTPASANSAAPYWEGVTPSGAIVMNEECPLQVKSENLTFDLQEFPSLYFDAEGVSAYTGKVTAEYNFYNPTEYAIRAKMLFPFGGVPSYYDEYGYDEDLGEYMKTPFADTQKYDITINGERIAKEIRYTWSTVDYELYPNQFEVETEMAKIQDEPIERSFYTPETPVYKYSYTVSATEKNYKKLYVPLTLDETQTCAQFNEDVALFYDRENTYVLYQDALETGNDTVVFYVIGTDFAALPPLYFKVDGVWQTETPENVTTTFEKTQTTFYELVTTNSGLADEYHGIDIYNAAMREFAKILGNSDRVPKIDHNALFDFKDHFVMRWCAYEMEVAPYATTTNAVTVPVYPTINNLDGYNRYNSYTYTYLLSPASTWSSFENLTIDIHTPYALTKSVLSGFEKMENGYTLRLASLPDGELSFTLRDPVNIQKEAAAERKALVKKIVGISVAVLVVGGVVALVVAKKIRKKKKKE